MSAGGDYWRRARQAANDPTWRQRAACRGMGPDLFYADSSGAALEVCARCPVKAKCAMTAAVNQEHNGVWGGKRRDRSRPLKTEQTDDEIAEAVLALVQRLAHDVKGAA